VGGKIYEPKRTAVQQKEQEGTEDVRAHQQAVGKEVRTRITQRAGSIAKMEGYAAACVGECLIKELCSRQTEVERVIGAGLG